MFSSPFSFLVSPRSGRNNLGSRPWRVPRHKLRPVKASEAQHFSPTPPFCLLTSVCRRGFVALATSRLHSFSLDPDELRIKCAYGASVLCDAFVSDRSYAEDINNVLYVSIITF